MNVWICEIELYICYVNNDKQTHNDMNIEAIKKEIPTKAQFEAAIKMAIAEYTNAAFDEGISPEKAQRLMMSREGLDLLANRAALYL